MTRRLVSSALVAALLVGAAVVGSAAASAGPIGCSVVPTPDGRVFPEPRVSLTFLRFDEFRCGVDRLERTYPSLIDVTTVGTSANQAPLVDVLLTDETVSGPKRKLLVVSSIHGNEPGGREGAARVIEDMVDPRLLANEPWVQAVLDQYVIHFLFPNPDGWTNGDLLGSPYAGGSSTRGNGHGKDLNRQFPVTGYIYTPNTTLSEPEGNGIIANLFSGKGRKNWFLGTDNHGQGADTYAAAGLQIVGQFDFQKSETLARFADQIDDEMATYGVLEDLEALRQATGQDLGPYHWGTLYDMLGYSASGSLIDYYNTVTGVNGTGFATELTAGSEVNMLAFPQELAQVWVDSIRSINYTMFKQAVEPLAHTYHVGGRTAYVFDPAVIRDDDANGSGYVRQPGEDIPQQPYRVTRMKFFSDLNRYADQPLSRITVRDVIRGGVDLSQFDSVVLANASMPGSGDEATYLDRLSAFVQGGGNLVVTDGAADVLAKLDLVAAEDVTAVPHYVGYVDFGDRSHPLNANLRGVARQTYDSVPIGYAFPPAGEHCPVWEVSKAAWEAAGGYTAGTTDGQTSYGELPVGQGMVRFIGALLPDPTEDYYHPYGLQNYAVTYTGYTILQNALDWTRP